MGDQRDIVPGHWKKQQLRKATHGIQSAAGWTTPKVWTGPTKNWKENSEDGSVMKPLLRPTLKRKRHEEEERLESSSSLAAMTVLRERNEVEGIVNGTSKDNRGIIQPVSSKSGVHDDNLESESPTVKQRRKKKTVEDNEGEDDNNNDSLLGMSKNIGTEKRSKLSGETNTIVSRSEEDDNHDSVFQPNSKNHKSLRQRRSMTVIENRPKLSGETNTIVGRSEEDDNHDSVFQPNSKNHKSLRQRRSMTVIEKRPKLSREVKNVSPPSEQCNKNKQQGTVLRTNMNNNQRSLRSVTLLVRLPHDDPRRLNVDKDVRRPDDENVTQVSPVSKTQLNQSCITSIPFLAANDLKELVATFYKDEEKKSQKKARRKKQRSSRW